MEVALCCGDTFPKEVQGSLFMYLEDVFFLSQVTYKHGCFNAVNIKAKNKILRG